MFQNIPQNSAGSQHRLDFPTASLPDVLLSSSQWVEALVVGMMSDHKVERDSV